MNNPNVYKLLAKQVIIFCLVFLSASKCEIFHIFGRISNPGLAEMPPGRKGTGRHNDVQ
jgi:hypothetical protein